MTIIFQDLFEMMLHQHLLGPSTSLNTNSNSVLQSANALSDGVLLSHSQQPREELKTTFETREGIYRVMTLAEYSRPRGPQQYHMQGVLNNQSMVHSGAPVRVSFVTIPKDIVDNNDTVTSQPTSSSSKDEPEDYWSDKLCFNVGKELYVYHYRGTHTAADLARPIDKRVYKGTAPTVHCFNQELANPKSCSLIIGFSTGQLQIIDPLDRSTPAPISRLYNEDRTYDKSTVTCIRWQPGQPNIFLASYASGNIYVYNEEVVAGTTPPVWNFYKQGEKFAVYTCKSKIARNPIYRWQIGEGAIHQFNFSGPDAKMMATVGHDGFLRIFDYHNMELMAMMKSYFGGLLTMSWSPDAKLIATGGEDDLLTVYSVNEKRVICRGQGHKSWISQVQFDSYCCTTEEDTENIEEKQNNSDVNFRPGPPPSTSSEINTTPVMRTHAKRATPLSATSTLSRCSFASFGTINGTSAAGAGVCYRIGSVGHDTLLCLWDITEDMLKPANIQRHRNSTIIAPMAGLEIQTSALAGRLDILTEASPAGNGGASTSSEPSPAVKPVEKPKKKRFHRRGFTLGRLNVGSSGNSNSNSNNSILPKTSNGSVNSSDKKNNHLLISQISCCEETRLLGSRLCPRIQDVPVIEPLMCKKIAHERLTVLEFRQDCIVTACQEGFICTWARPGKGGGNPNGPKRDFINSPGTVSPDVGGAQQQKPNWAGYNVTNTNEYTAMNGISGQQPTRSNSSYNTADDDKSAQPYRVNNHYRWQN
ncbi:unnamed protein product [Caenorhabditis angaria]|uniref:WD_REPEATS_REGION domain-containing protein n=1 Tax=Caenorhabditis angaria TaxID=860376 RepID=A0A9P1J0L8_9PELO|nr:unnamed protein product [Caenorhabditis angaria]